MQSRHVVLARRPEGMPVAADFRVETREMPPLADGRILLELSKAAALWILNRPLKSRSQAMTVPGWYCRELGSPFVHLKSVKPSAMTSARRSIG